MCSFFFFKLKTAYEMRISDWSADVCSSDLRLCSLLHVPTGNYQPAWVVRATDHFNERREIIKALTSIHPPRNISNKVFQFLCQSERNVIRSEEHTSELQSLMRISYAVFCLKKKKKKITNTKQQKTSRRTKKREKTTIDDAKTH